jgi:hypothetical protein
MVEYNQAYKGSTHIGYIYKNGKIVKKIYKGSTLIYQLGFNPVTFNPSSSIQSFTVPLGVSKIHVDCVASKGRDVTQDSITSAGGNGGRVECDLAVHGGETLYIAVGDIPTSETPTYNASDIRLGGTALTDRVIVAGGGGAAAVAWHYGYRGRTNGGAGGGTTGGNGGITNPEISRVATGGTQSAGGNGAYMSFFQSRTGENGALGLGGASASFAVGHYSGAGGAGYYGGGGGVTGSFASEDGGGAWACGSGGGSSYTNASCSNVVHTQGYRDGAGYVTISFVS